MPRYKLIVLSNPVAGREDECDRWYQNTHLGQMLSLKGFKRAQRFRLARTMGQRDSWSYAAIYEIETDDIDAVQREIETAAASGRLDISDALAREFAYAAIYEESGAPVTVDDGVDERQGSA